MGIFDNVMSKKTPNDVMDYKAGYLELTAKYENLENQFEAWKENSLINEKQYRDNETKMRKFLEGVLSADRREMQIRKKYTWNDLTLSEMIERANDSIRYVHEQDQQLMQKLLEQLQQRTTIIDGLRAKIDALSSFHGGEPIFGSSMDVTETAATEEEEEKEIKGNLSTGTMEVVELDSDGISNSEKDLLEKTAKQAKEMQLKTAPNSAKVTIPARKKNLMDKSKELAAELHNEQIKSIVERFDDVNWAIMEAIGTEGYSRTIHIREYIKKKVDLKDTAFNGRLKSMVTNGFVNEQAATNPIATKLMVYSLSESGRYVYSKKYGKPPVISEAEKVRASHDNLDHGYAIVFLGEEMAQRQDLYQKVDYYSRGHNEVVVSSNEKATFVPDISYLYKGKNQSYIEYERGTHTTENFRKKCDKMLACSRSIEFVVPNRKTLSDMKEKVIGWLQTKDLSKMKGTKVRLASLREFRDSIRAGEMDPWMIVFDLNTGLTPIKDATEIKMNTLEDQAEE